jgi:diguanylate cyclase (GGDEF)-like protein/PAS domain S-box-containing protein
LQNKGKRYFFTDTIKLNAGEVFVSPIDLNIEGNAVEVPWKPMIRVGSPVFDNRNTKRGIVMLNYFGRDLLDRIRQFGQTNLFLLNTDGYWLLGPNAQSEFGFMFKRDDLTLGQQHPEVWSIVAASDTGQLEVEGGIWTYETVYPLLQGMRSSSGSYEAFAPSRSEVDTMAYKWKLLDFVPREAYQQPANQMGIRILTITVLVLALLALALRRTSHAIRREDRAIAYLQEANQVLEERVAARTRELEDEVQERRRAEDAAREAAKQYQSILEATADGFWLVDADGRIRDCNGAYCDNLGFRRDEVVGKSVKDFEALHTPEMIARMIERVRRHTNAQFETQHRARDGSVRDLEVSIALVPGTGFEVAFLRDITTRKQTEARVRQLARVVEVASSPVMVTTSDATIVYVNPAFTAVTGYASGEVAGRSPSILSSGRHDSLFFAEFWRQLTAFGHWQGELWNRRKDGALIAETVAISDVRDEQGTVTHYVAIYSDVTRLMDRAENLQQLAHHDGLTGLPNRLLVMARLEHAIAQARREKCGIALMFIDLDHFKEVNDRASHAAGDQLLQTIAKRMQSVCRAGDTLGRLGGDEFVMLLEDVRDARNVDRVGEAVLELFPIEVPVTDGVVSVTASIGLAFFPQDGADVHELLDASDRAMYKAKQSGRNRVSRC